MTFRQALQRLTRMNQGRPGRRPRTSRRRFELEALPDRTLLSVSMVGPTLVVNDDNTTIGTTNTVTIEYGDANHIKVIDNGDTPTLWPLSFATIQINGSKSRRHDQRGERHGLSGDRQ